jgi:threonine synthase
MSDLILLKEPLQCPSCRRNAAPALLPARCRNCGMMLFKASDNFKKFEDETGWREYFIFFTETGWKHRSHVYTTECIEVQRETVLDRTYKPPELPSNYGTEEFIKDKLDNSRFELKEEIRQIKKKKRRKYSIGTKFAGQQP